MLIALNRNIQGYLLYRNIFLMSISQYVSKKTSLNLKKSGHYAAA